MGYCLAVTRRSPLLLLLLAACGDPGTRDVGDACLTSLECPDESVCFPTAEPEVNRCMSVCDAETRLCEDGTVCLAGASGAERVCYLGGEREVGESCEDGDECAAGAVCILEDGAAVCRRACDTRLGTGCAENQVCAELVAPAGYCAERPPEEEPAS